MRILRIDSSAKTETSQSRRLSNRIIDGSSRYGSKSGHAVASFTRYLQRSFVGCLNLSLLLSGSRNRLAQERKHQVLQNVGGGTS
jgi:hypothetical protein